MRFLVVTLSLVLVGCQQPSPVQTRAPPKADLVLSKVRLRSWSDGALTAVTTAERLEVSRQTGERGAVQAFDAGVLFVKQGALVTAPLVQGNFLAGQLEASGGVTMKGREGVHAQAPRVDFERAQGSAGVASGDAGLRFSRPGLDVEADAFSLDVGDEHATFDGIRSTFSRAP